MFTKHNLAKNAFWKCKIIHQRSQTFKVDKLDKICQNERFLKLTKQGYEFCEQVFRFIFRNTKLHLANQLIRVS